MIQFAEGFLVNVIPHTHKGKLEKARHGRGKTVGLLSANVHIQQNGAPGQLVQNIPRLRERQLPCRCGRLCGKWLDGKLRYQPGLLFGKQYLENTEQHVGGRRALREAVEAVGQAAIGGIIMVMGHCLYLRNENNQELDAVYSPQEKRARA